MGPQWGEPHSLDPNWRDGEYHGHRMRLRPAAGAYGWHRAHHAYDLGGHGGFDGLYDEGPGWYDRAGQYHHPSIDQHEWHVRRGGPRAYDGWARHVEDGGVRGDAQYLRQYNAASPMLRGGYDRGYGWAPAGRERAGPGPRRLRRPMDERGYAGYNRGGFAQEQRPGLDPRK